MYHMLKRDVKKAIHELYREPALLIIFMNTISNNLTEV